ncbi:MAG: helix-turn-helix domain-containing protein [Parcubacteria group bacterium]|jgi:sugar-specific transcriptional regulator TrmB
MEIQNTLKKLGLDDDEIAVYTATLSLGPSLVTRIAKESGVKRTTVYLVAKSLMEKGLLGEYKTRHGMHLSAQSPDYLLTKIEEQKKEVEEIIPQLKALTKKEAHRPQVKYFEGKEGYFTVAEDTLEKHATEILWLGNPKELYSIIGKKWDDEYYVPKRMERKIKMKALLFEDDWSRDIKKTDENFLRQTKFLPKDFPFHSTQLIYQNKVAYFSSQKELICVLIESADLAAMERAKFEMLWKNAIIN